MGVLHDRGRHAPEQGRLDAGEPTSSQHDRLGVDIVGDVADRSPRLASDSPALHLEACPPRQLAALSDPLLGEISRDFIETQRTRCELRQGSCYSRSALLVADISPHGVGGESVGQESAVVLT
jgi:hypothetical protein